MNTTSKLLSILVITLCGTPIARADEACSDALVISTYDRFDKTSNDFRLASYVAESAYNEVKKSAGASAVIYGVPVRGSYDDFRKNVKQMTNKLDVSLSQSQASNVMWSGLDANGTNAYVECIRAKKFAQGGLHLAVRSATKSEVTVWAMWRPTGNEGVAKPEWTWNADGAKVLPGDLLAGERVIVLPRPKDQRVLAVNFAGHADSLVVEPYPELPALISKPVEYVEELIQTRGPQVQSFGGGFSRTSTVCTPEKPEGWTIVKVVDRLESDTGRTICNSWTTCSGTEADTSRRACRSYSVQGYRKGEYGGYGRATMVLDVTWRHPKE